MRERWEGRKEKMRESRRNFSFVDDSEGKNLSQLKKTFLWSVKSLFDQKRKETPNKRNISTHLKFKN